MNKYLRMTAVFFVCTYFWSYAHTYTEWHALDSVNLIFHEAGHTIFYFFGTFVHILAGSGFQITIPALIALYFFYTRQKISSSLCLLWVGQNFLNVSVYAGDAVKMQLDLLGGDSVTHDWHYLLSTLGWLQYTDTVASTLYALGIVCILLGTVFSLYCASQNENDNLN